MRRPSAAARASLRSVFTGAALRAIAGVRDAGENLLVRVANIDAGDHVEHGDGDADVWVHYRETLTGLPGIARLFVPGNLLWALPAEDESAAVVRPADGNGPGVAYLLHGDVGASDRIPAWLRTKVGLWFKDKILRVESAEEHVELVPGSGKKLACGASADEASLQPAPLGTDLNNYLVQMQQRINDLEAFCNAIRTAYNLHVHPETGANTGPPAATVATTVPANIGAPPALSAVVYTKP